MADDRFRGVGMSLTKLHCMRCLHDPQMYWVRLPLQQEELLSLKLRMLSLANVELSITVLSTHVTQCLLPEHQIW